MPYEVEVAVVRAAYPYRVTGVADETRAFEIIANSLAAWGIPVPVGMRYGSVPFAALLVDRGAYAATVDGASIKVTRSK